MAQKNYVSNSTESIRMFDKDWMEALSKVHFTVPLIFFVPIISILYYLGIVSGEVTLMNGLLWGAFGLLTWTVTEYMLHRFIFHYHPTSEFGKKIHFIFHGVHHDYPRDRLRLVMPPSVSIPLATLFYFLFDALIAGALLFPFFGSFLLKYLIYDMFHYAIHHLEVKGKLWNVLKTHHLKHHYVNPDKGYGVSSPIWDYIIGTEFEESKTKAQVSHD